MVDYGCTQIGQELYKKSSQFLQKVCFNSKGSYFPGFVYLI